MVTIQIKENDIDLFNESKENNTLNNVVNLIFDNLSKSSQEEINNKGILMNNIEKELVFIVPDSSTTLQGELDEVFSKFIFKIV